MSRVSKEKPKKQAIILDTFLQSIALLKNKDEVKNFLKALLTPTEMEMLAKRLKVASLLLHDETYTGIQKQLHVTNATITHVRASLVQGGYAGYIKPLQRLEKKTKKKRARLVKKFRPASGKPSVKLAAKISTKQYRKWRK